MKSDHFIVLLLTPVVEESVAGDDLISLVDVFQG